MTGSNTSTFVYFNSIDDRRQSISPALYKDHVLNVAILHPLLFAFIYIREHECDMFVKIKMRIYLRKNICIKKKMIIRIIRDMPAEGHCTLITRIKPHELFNKTSSQILTVFYYLQYNECIMDDYNVFRISN